MLLKFRLFDARPDPTLPISPRLAQTMRNSLWGINPEFSILILGFLDQSSNLAVGPLEEAAVVRAETEKVRCGS